MHALMALAAQENTSSFSSLPEDAQNALAFLALAVFVVVCLVIWMFFWRLPRSLHDLIMSKVAKNLAETDLIRFELAERRESKRTVANDAAPQVPAPSATTNGIPGQPRFSPRPSGTQHGAGRPY